MSKTDASVMYPEFKTKEFPYAKGLKVSQAKEMIGWEEEPEGGKFGDKYDLLDMNRKKIRLTRGQGTPFLKEHAVEYAYEFLNKRIKFNGQPYTIGKMGTVHSGRHRLVGQILAEQIRLGQQAEHWATIWGENEITAPCLVVYGIDDDDETVNSIDTGNSRSVADMLFRSDLFKGKKADVKKEMAKALDLGIRVFWERTGAKFNPWAPRRTHSEIMDCLNRHRKLLKMTDHIITENGDGGLNSILKPGILVGYGYLMAASATESAVYASVNPSERQEAGKKGIDFLNWDKATQFFVDLNTSKKLLAVHEKIGLIVDGGADGSSFGGTVKERVAVVLRAWNLYVRGKKITVEDLDIGSLKEKNNPGVYKPGEDGKRSVEDSCIVGGIDFGPSGKLEVEVEETPEEATQEVAPSAAEETVDPKKAARDKKKNKLLATRNKKPATPVVEAPEEESSDDAEPTTDDIEEIDEEGEDE